MTARAKPFASPRADLAEEVGRLTHQFRRMPHSKFAKKLEPYGDRADAGSWLAGRLAALAQGIEERESEAPPTWRALPVLGPFALGDQIAVVGADVLAAYDALPGDPADTQVWTPGDGRIPADKALAAVLESTTALRKRL